MKRLIWVLYFINILTFAQDGMEFVIETQMLDREGRPAMDKKGNVKVASNVAWIPKNSSYIRGVIVAHGMIKDLALEDRFRKVAEEEDLATLVVNGFTWNVEKNWEILDNILNEMAEKSSHPEIKLAPVLVGGLSASVLMIRLLGYERPERVFGIIHVAGGNMHQQYPQGKSLANIPFIAMNGEFESCGPEGGIRPHLGLDTQWYMMVQQMIERRRQDPAHLMSMVVVPSKGHTAWNKQLAELFIRKAAKYRLPTEKRDGSTPAICRIIPVEDGWLSDPNVKYPQHKPAPYDNYTGDKSSAMWHFDEEMAMAVWQYHKNGIRSGQARSVFRPAGSFQKLWPLGEHADIKFEGNSYEAKMESITRWFKLKLAGIVMEEVLPYIARSIAENLNVDQGSNFDEGGLRKICLKVCHIYDDNFKYIADSISISSLPEKIKIKLINYYGDKILYQWVQSRYMPLLSVSGIQKFVGSLDGNKIKDLKEDEFFKTVEKMEEEFVDKIQTEYGALPSDFSALVSSLKDKDSQKGWEAVEKLAVVGKPAIPTLLRLMDWEEPPADFRAVAAIGKMGEKAREVLADIERVAYAGGRTTEEDSLRSVEALKAIELIKGTGGQ